MTLKIMTPNFFIKPAGQNHDARVMRHCFSLITSKSKFLSKFEKPLKSSKSTHFSMNCLSFSNSKFVRFCLFVCLKGGTVGTSWKSGFQCIKSPNLHLHKQANIRFVNLDYICRKNRCQRVQKQKKNI